MDSACGRCPIAINSFLIEMYVSVDVHLYKINGETQEPSFTEELHRELPFLLFFFSLLIQIILDSLADLYFYANLWRFSGFPLSVLKCLRRTKK